MRAKLKLKTKRRCISARNKGSTLTEVVVASSLLLIAIIPMLRGMSNSHLVSASVEQKTRALVMAQAKMDEIRARSINSYSGSFKESNTLLVGAYLCTVNDSSGGPDMRTITVSVGYDGDDDNKLDSDEIDAELSTMIARRI
jgi:Tfp pilus assembly protein PilV